MTVLDDSASSTGWPWWRPRRAAAATTLTVVLTPLLDLVAPPHCLGCGVRAPLPFCPRCDAAVAALRVHDRGRVRAAYRYAGPIARAVVAGKVTGATAAWAPLGDRLAAALAPRPPLADVVVPVATDPRRRRARGIDHTRVLAERVAASLGLPVVAAVRLQRRAPDRGRVRAGGTDATVSTFVVPPPRAADVAGRRVLVVDDVVTTGATLRAVGRALHQARAADVQAALLARATAGLNGPIR